MTNNNTGNFFPTPQCLPTYNCLPQYSGVRGTKNCPWNILFTGNLTHLPRSSSSKLLLFPCVDREPFLIKEPPKVLFEVLKGSIDEDTSDLNMIVDDNFPNDTNHPIYFLLAEFISWESHKKFRLSLSKYSVLYPFKLGSRK